MLQTLYFHVFADEYLTKHWLIAKEKKTIVTKYPHTLNHKVQKFSKYIYFVMCTECQILIKAHTTVVNYIEW